MLKTLKTYVKVVTLVTNCFHMCFLCFCFVRHVVYSCILPHCDMSFIRENMNWL